MLCERLHCSCCNLSFQGQHGRSRIIPRTVHITPSSAGGLSSHAHLNGHAATSSGSRRVSPHSYRYDSKRRLQPIGADAAAKVTETMRINGIVKRTSLVMDSSSSQKGSQTTVTLSMRQNSQDSRKSISSTSSADQAPADSGLQQQFLPPIV